MLNPDLKLNEKIFDEDVEKQATRTGFGDGLVELGETNKDVVVLTADLKESTNAHKFAERFPERFFEIGVAEQNMAAIAAGLGVSGKIPFISSYAVFSPGKNWETIRTTCVYNNSNVKIAGHHAGIITGPDGPTHQATEDIAITRCLPGLDVYVPCDVLEAKKATILSASYNGPVYLRFSREKTPVITTPDSPFEAGKMYKFWTSENPMVSIFSTGHMTYYALLAAKELENEGINTLVINVASISPFDTENLREFTKETKAVVTVEDHQIKGGLGGLISEELAKTTPLPMELVGLHDTFAESGSSKELIEKYDMNEDAIKEAVQKVISRK